MHWIAVTLEYGPFFRYGCIDCLAFRLQTINLSSIHMYVHIHTCKYLHIQGDQKVSVLWGSMKNSVYSNNLHTIDDLKMAITEYIRNTDRAILNTVFENTLRRVNNFLETGGGNFERYL
jgi:hypothetical protein